VRARQKELDKMISPACCCRARPPVSTAFPVPAVSACRASCPPAR